MNDRTSPSDPSSRPSRRAHVELPPIRFASVTEAECVEHICNAIHEQRGGWLVTANLDHLLRCRRDSSYRQMVDESDMVVADGMPLIWASRLQGTPLPERVTGSNLVHSLTAEAARRGQSVYLLGGTPGVAEQAAEMMCRQHAGLRIAGVHCPPFGFERDDAELALIQTKLHAAEPDIVYVALGSPKQEKLIQQLRGEFPGTWWAGVGISLGFITGEVNRAPRWMQRTGLEWVHRLWQEPGRLARRYVIDGIPFAVVLIVQSVLRRSRLRSAVG